jgi:peptidyl-prolyl cis-trans isomerase D
MLKVFRKRKLFIRILLFVIVGLVGFMMVVTLVPGLSGGGAVSMRDPQGVLARVNKVSITQEEAQRQYRRRVQQMGGEAPGLRQLLMKGVIDDLITQAAVEYEARRLGLGVTPEEVRAQLRQISLLYPGGKFVGPELYQQIIQAQMQMTVPEFEEAVRRQLLLNKVALWVTGGISVSPDEVEQEYRQQNEHTHIEYVAFDPAQFARQLQPSEEDLRAYFQANQERYQEPERRIVRFVPIDSSELSRRVSVTPQELEDFYRRNIEDYRVPEQVRVRHILLLRPESTPTGEKAQGSEAPAEDPIRQKAEKLLNELRHGADFAKLAKENSDDAGSRDNGGEIGWVRRGQTVPALEQVIFSVPAGSEPQLVQTSYGYHIVQVMERQQARVKPLAEVRSEIEPVLRQQKVQREALAQARRIVEAVRNGATLDDATRQEGWAVRETSPFAQGDTLPAFGRDREFQEAAYRLPAASAGQPNGPVSDPVVVPAGYAVLQLKEVQPAHQATFEEVRSKVENAYRQEKGAEQAREAAQKFAGEVESGTDFRRVARQAGLEVKTPDPFTRRDMIPGLGPARDIAAAAFSLPVGKVSPAVSLGGKWAVFQVLDRQQVDASQITPEQRDAIRETLLNQKRTLAWRIFTENIRKRLTSEGKLELNQAAIDRLTTQS